METTLLRPMVSQYSGRSPPKKSHILYLPVAGHPLPFSDDDTPIAKIEPGRVHFQKT